MDEFITIYPVAEDDQIAKRLTKTQPGFIRYDDEDEQAVSDGDARYPGKPLGKIQINNEQYFGRVPKKAWTFYIGGYQPAQKWLKDRRNRTLSVDEVKHYQKIIVALMETDRIMQVIDAIEIE